VGNGSETPLAAAVAANDTGVSHRAPGSVRVIIRQPEDTAAALATMKNFVQEFARIAVKQLHTANEPAAPIDIAPAT
jgi:hypothetical protein